MFVRSVPPLGNDEPHLNSSRVLMINRRHVHVVFRWFVGSPVRDGTRYIRTQQLFMLSLPQKK
jgi:hypothetical protein